MSSLTVRKERETQAAPTSGREYQPFQMMRRLFGWDPFRELAPLGSFFEEQPAVAFMPAFEVKETNGTYLFKADVPGIAEKDMEITLTGNRLTVSGKREAEKEDKGDTYYTYERSYGSFTRAFTLPQGADMENIKADLKDGVLTLIVPKTPETQPRKVALGSSSPRS